MNTLSRCASTIVFCVSMQVCAAGVAAAETRHVGKSGSDWGNTSCAEATPCKSIGYAVGVVASAGDTIQIAHGTFIEASVHVTKNLTIVGAGSFLGTNVTTHGAGSVFSIAPGVTASLSKMVIFDGHASEGGGIFNRGDLTVKSATVRNNAAGSGGGIYNIGTLSLDRVTINSNTAGLGGGLTTVGLRDATVLIHESRIVSNQATGLTQDVGRIGGIAHSGEGTVLIVRSAVAWNTDVGIASSAPSGSPLILQDSTISSNAGVGLMRRNGSATLTNVTIAQNGSYGLDVRDAVVTFRNSIVANNDPEAWSNFGAQCALQGAGVINADHSLFGDFSCNPNIVDWLGSQVGIDPRLTALGYHGGFTPIHQLLPGSPAIDAANSNWCWSWDQHGSPRPVDGDGDGVKRCDIGAYERKLYRQRANPDNR